MTIIFVEEKNKRLQYEVMELKDLFPEKPEFTLSKTNKTYHLRIVNMEDRAFLQRKFSSDNEWQEMFNKLYWDKICQVVYRLLEEKSDFLASTEEFIDDDGVLKKEFISGPHKLLKSLVNQDEALRMLGALTTAIKESEPVIKESFDKEIKKKILEIETQTSEKSTMQSQVSMDLPQEILAS